MGRLTLILVTTCFAAFAQHGTAPSGYYPFGYTGDIWTGEVSSTDATTREITITYTNKKKTETFTGVLVENYEMKINGSIKKVEPTDIPKGVRVTLFYQAKMRKIGGQKVKYYEIFRVVPAATP